MEEIDRKSFYLMMEKYRDFICTVDDDDADVDIYRKVVIK